MIKGAPATAEATAIPGASATTEMQNYPASDSDPSGCSDVVLLCQITGSDPASLEHCLNGLRGHLFEATNNRHHNNRSCKTFHYYIFLIVPSRRRSKGPLPSCYD